jgi:dATP/dGTP diphosphohydrolase, N-terminal
MSEKAINPKDRQGAKKPQLHLVPAVALLEEAEVMALGARKYGAYNWRDKAVLLSVYISAAQRHLLAMQDGQWFDPESLRPHAAHVRACMGIILDADSLGKMERDLPYPGKAAERIVELTRREPNPQDIASAEKQRLYGSGFDVKKWAGWDD